MPQFSLYTLITLLSSVVVALMGILLLAISTPKDPALRNYRISRRILAIGYLILSAAGPLDIWGNLESSGMNITATAILSLVVLKRTYMAFVTAYTFFFVYFALKFINYPKFFNFDASETTESPNNSSDKREPSKDSLHDAVEKWVASGKFVDPTISLKSLSAELNTNSAYLSRHINTKHGQNFRSWINALRINEAKKLIDSNPHMPLVEIGEKVGISSSTTFYRHFVIVTGMTPAEYRRKKQ